MNSTEITKAADHFGMEMLWKLEQNNVNTKSDLMVLFVHWYLMKNGFRNVGVGDDKSLNSSVEQSELLPEGWNANSASYALRYTINDELYNLHGTLSNGKMIINLLHAKNLRVSIVVFNLDTAVQSIRGSKMKDLIDKIDEQIDRLDNELLKPIQSEQPKTSSAPPIDPSWLNRFIRNPGNNPVRSELGSRLQFPVYGVGSADRDPLGGLGGGMLMDPLRPGRPNFLPRPRIDPMGPNNRINQFPNPDHLPPPGYDDMFM
ncbi:proteasome inhibitor PI31 subunit [Anopheles maculipalpis]|uniref:proteasome inhibitor PI31 subunit n=1 Tax=Anopheles maculipalpis TaxID=1496333 RepID=UPI002159B158|nr:proteasome inhibitor PI31 subunit [Anopheles maculipalpis]